MWQPIDNKSPDLDVFYSQTLSISDYEDSRKRQKKVFTILFVSFNRSVL